MSIDSANGGDNEQKHAKRDRKETTVFDFLNTMDVNNHNNSGNSSDNHESIVGIYQDIIRKSNLNEKKTEKFKNKIFYTSSKNIF